MNIAELESLIANAGWFEHLTEPVSATGFVQIPCLDPWAKIPTGDDRLEEIADRMDWLPTSRDQDDPIHGKALEERSEQLGRHKENSRQSLDIYKRALASLRDSARHPALKAGPNDFTDAAHGAALFASRRAAYEVLLEDCGFWCSVLNQYRDGHWPCGLLPDGTVVVL